MEYVGEFRWVFEWLGESSACMVKSEDYRWRRFGWYLEVLEMAKDSWKSILES